MHVCGRCKNQYDTEEQYLNHTCPETNQTPKDPEHLGPRFATVQQKALERGEARKEQEESKK